MRREQTDPRHRRWLFQLTALPTAAGREDRVVRWVQAWARRRKQVVVRTDRCGNLELRRRGRHAGTPIYFTAHMDHPAFVVTDVADRRTVVAEFRGGVREEFFVRSKVLLHHGRARPQRGTVRCRASGVSGDPRKAASEDKRWEIRMDDAARAEPGDVLTWDVGPAREKNGRLHAPACDDLAGAAAAFGAFDLLLAGRARPRPDVRILLTRAEEVGFIGALAAVKARSIPRQARLITLENSRSFSDSPVGGGPIVRVGDRTSTFDPDLTYRVGRIADVLAQDDARFRWQRKLMAGGTCEASAFAAYGYRAACLCLALGNYHNMNDATGRIDAESISLADFHDLVRLLVSIGLDLDDTDKAPGLRQRLDKLFSERRGVLDVAATKRRLAPS